MNFNHLDVSVIKYHHHADINAMELIILINPFHMYNVKI